MHALLPSSYADDGWRTFQGVRVPSWISLSSSGQYFWQGVCNQRRALVSVIAQRMQPRITSQRACHILEAASVQRSSMRHTPPVSALSSSDTDTPEAHAY